MLKNGYFIPENDIVQTLPDGREMLLLAKGVPVPEAEARRLGYIKDGGVGPTETKADDAFPFEVPSDPAPAVTPDVPLAIGSNATNPQARKRVSK